MTLTVHFLTYLFCGTWSLTAVWAEGRLAEADWQQDGMRATQFRARAWPGLREDSYWDAWRQTLQGLLFKNFATCFRHCASCKLFKVFLFLSKDPEDFKPARSKRFLFETNSSRSTHLTRCASPWQRSSSSTTVDFGSFQKELQKWFYKGSVCFVWFCAVLKWGSTLSPLGRLCFCVRWFVYL